jgi:ribosome maturation factor RimP
MTDKTALLDLLEAEVASLGYELVDLDLRIGGDGLLRLYIDAEDGITLDDCERVSHQVSGLLDVEDPIPGHYTLEVSSPGVNRPLRTRAHYRRFAGERAKVELARPREDGRRRFTGLLGPVEDDEFALELDGETVRLRFDDVATARLAPRIKV